MKKSFLILILIAVLGAGVYWYLGEGGSGDGSGEEEITLKSYSSLEHGISFDYPANYFLEEREVGNGERKHYAIIITEDTEENRAVREGEAPAREGPTAISIDIFQNDLDKQTADDWIKNSNDSNFKLSSGSFTNKNVGGMEAVVYQASGLYESYNYVVGNDKFIYKLSVTWLTPEDSMVGDFEEILKTIKIN